MNEHSPGPWADWRRDDGVFHIGTAAEPHVYICRMVGEQRDPEVEANAALIIAAPDLLAAVEELLHVGRWIQSAADWDAILRAREAGYRALQKARGEEVAPPADSLDPFEDTP